MKMCYDRPQNNPFENCGSEGASASLPNNFGQEILRFPGIIFPTTTASDNNNN